MPDQGRAGLSVLETAGYALICIGWLVWLSGLVAVLGR